MVVVSESNVLTVGIEDKAEVLEKLTVRVVSLQFGTEAGRSLKSKKFNSVISKWDLADMEDGKFLQVLRSAKPDLPTIAIIEPGNYSQEISARSLGVSAVLTSDASDDLFLATVSEVLGLNNAELIKSIYAVGKK